MNFDFAKNDCLLGINEICEKLGISRSTFERIRNPDRTNSSEPRQPSLSSSIMGKAAVPSKDEFEGILPFPQPTLVLGRSPRWSVSVLNRWIAECGMH